MSSIMVMLATEQQIANFKVFRHYHPDKVLSLTSTVASERSWNHGIGHEVCRILGRSDAFVVCAHEDHGLQVNALRDSFKALLWPHLQDDAVERVIWNWTGAQKPHSAALLILAHVLYEEDLSARESRRHTIVYADRDKLITNEGGGLDTLDSELKAEEILRVHNMVVEPKAAPEPVSDVLYRDFLSGGSVRNDSWRMPPYLEELERLASQQANGTPVKFNDVQDAFTEPVQLEHIQKLSDAYCAKRKEPRMQFLDSPLLSAANDEIVSKMLRSSLTKIGLRTMRRPSTVRIGTGFDFEGVAIRCMEQWYERQGYRSFAEMRFNIEVRYPSWEEAPPVVGEFDCLLISRSGSFYAIDFKSAGKSADYRRQAATVRLAAGVFASFYYLYPWFACDVVEQETWAYPRTGLEPHVERRISGIVHMDRQLKQSGIRFYDDPGRFDREMATKLRLG